MDVTPAQQPKRPNALPVPSHFRARPPSLRSVVTWTFCDAAERASDAVPVFVCEPIPPRDAEEVAKAYLIDAAISQAEGRGPLVV
jgi:hypothetical protein